MRLHKSGFTLVEILVVISIIGFIASITLVSLNVVRAKARDVRRLTDKGAIIKALNLAYNQSWPESPSSGSNFACLGLYDEDPPCSRAANGSTFLTNELSKYLSPIPNLGDVFPHYYMYASHFSWTDAQGEHPMGAYLFWVQEVDMTDQECGPIYRYGPWGGYWQCYEFLGP